jgi:hypothetical protein
MPEPTLRDLAEAYLGETVRYVEADVVRLVALLSQVKTAGVREGWELSAKYVYGIDQYVAYDIRNEATKWAP